MPTVTAIEKKGPVIICTTDDPKHRVYKLDFKEAKIYGITGKQIKSAGPIVDNIPPSLHTNVLYSALRVFYHSYECEKIPYYGTVESLLSYPDLLPFYIDMSLVNCLVDNYDGKLPKGYIAWCRENERKLCLDTLQDFINERTVQQWPEALRNSLKKVYDGTDFDLAKATQYDKELCMASIRMINNSLKRYEFRYLLANIQEIIAFLRHNPHLRPYLDDTKSAKVACEILQSAFNKERNRLILANEARIAALNGVKVGEYVIKVPSTIEDFTDEGAQQHNCVGHYYHDAMARGNTLIYFLRRAKEPNKSYVTCRYKIDEKETVEHRSQYNNPYNNDSLFAQIDNMIQSVLKQ